MPITGKIKYHELSNTSLFTDRMLSTMIGITKNFFKEGQLSKTLVSLGIQWETILLGLI
jgi:hypothetical protein